MSKQRKRQNGESTLERTELSAANGGHPEPERISARAYELYLARGGADGQAWDDWLAAERELSEAVVPRNDRRE